MKTKKPDPRAIKAAKQYIEPAIRYALTDCSDSKHDSDEARHRFEAVTDDRVKIGAFIADHLMPEYIKALREQIEQYGSGETPETFECGVCEPPVPAATVRKYLRSEPPR